MQDIQQLIQGIISQTRNKVSSIPSYQQQRDQLINKTPEQMQKEAMDLMMAGTIGSPRSVENGVVGMTRKLVGNQPKIAGTLIDVGNLKNLNPEDYMGAIDNMRVLVGELLPNQAKSKAMQSLASKDVELWMQKMAKEIIKKTKIYPGMGE